MGKRKQQGRENGKGQRGWATIEWLRVSFNEKVELEGSGV